MKIDKAIKSGNSIEFIVEEGGYRIHGILTKGIYFNWIAFPELNVCCELASLNDIYWNSDALNSIFESIDYVNIILHVISLLTSMFDEEEITYFDGHHFISTREYIFWLEHECESLSRQLVEFEMYINNGDVDKWLEHARLDYYRYIREQYSKEAFLE